MWLITLLTLCCLTAGSCREAPDFCSQDLNLSIQPGSPIPIETNNPRVLKAARYSVERFNNCTNDIFLYKEAHISRAMVQVVNGLKFMLEMQIRRTTCRKTAHPSLDHCDFQTSPALQQTLWCYSVVWVIPWLQWVQVPVLRCTDFRLWIQHVLWTPVSPVPRSWPQLPDRSTVDPNRGLRQHNDSSTVQLS
ncbi:Cystatin-F [Heterocephalus glaber]|uniref:Cystatin-F n=1 Tax=Heterocephalus glaber TaxID=10181 RepID=G5BJV8_HETGA|nr:cystatin-F [Heterocephalus glaber]EHB09569.1 Cystatin-F [Heterocephalus glaber]